MRSRRSASAGWDARPPSPRGRPDSPEASRPDAPGPAASGRPVGACVPRLAAGLALLAATGLVGRSIPGASPPSPPPPVAPPACAAPSRPCPPASASGREPSAAAPLAAAREDDGRLLFRKSPAREDLTIGSAAGVRPAGPGPSTAPRFRTPEAPPRPVIAAARRLLSRFATPGPDPSRRVRVADEEGRVQVARVYGPPELGWVLLPDGRLARTNRLVDSDEPFRPLGRSELRSRLEAGEFRGFACRETDHYLVFYQCTEEFAAASAHLLESLYRGLQDRLPELGVAVRPAEFPLVAVIYRDEEDFRARREVDPDIQAYYEVVSNRIVFYERRDRDGDDPQVAAMRRPQTVAHEGTHQILQNTGVQPRLASWPIWLVEGLAELASASTAPDGGWGGLSVVNPLHMATIHDLEDRASLHARGVRLASDRVGRDRGSSTVRYLATREDLTPTDYALAWALTHYLANQQTEKFVAYLRSLGRIEPLRPSSPAEHLERFERAFGPDFPALDRQVRKHLAGLRYTRPVYFAVTFEQPQPGGFVRRGTVVSQSPMVIREWIEQNLAPQGGPYLWQAVPFRSHARAVQYADRWLRVHSVP